MSEVLSGGCHRTGQLFFREYMQCLSFGFIRITKFKIETVY